MEYLPHHCHTGQVKPVHQIGGFFQGTARHIYTVRRCKTIGLWKLASGGMGFKAFPALRWASASGTQCGLELAQVCACHFVRGSREEGGGGLGRRGQIDYGLFRSHGLRDRREGKVALTSCTLRTSAQFSERSPRRSREKKERKEWISGRNKCVTKSVQLPSPILLLANFGRWKCASAKKTRIHSVISTCSGVETRQRKIDFTKP